MKCWDKLQACGEQGTGRGGAGGRFRGFEQNGMEKDLGQEKGWGAEGRGGQRAAGGGGGREVERDVGGCEVQGG